MLTKRHDTDLFCMHNCFYSIALFLPTASPAAFPGVVVESPYGLMPPLRQSMCASHSSLPKTQFRLQPSPDTFFVA